MARGEHSTGSKAQRGGLEGARGATDAPRERADTVGHETAAVDTVGHETSTAQKVRAHVRGVQRCGVDGVCVSAWQIPRLVRQKHADGVCKTASLHACMQGKCAW